MKYLFWLLLIATFPAFSQGYVGLGATNKGAQFSAGVLANNVDINIRYQLPLLSTEIPKILSFNVGHSNYYGVIFKCFLNQ